MTRLECRWNGDAARCATNAVLNTVGIHRNPRTQCLDVGAYSQSTEALFRDAVEVVHAWNGPPGQVATLILPADVSWGEDGVPVPPLPPAAPRCASDEAITRIAGALRGGRAQCEPALVAAASICDALLRLQFAHFIAGSLSDRTDSNP